MFAALKALLSKWFQPSTGSDPKKDIRTSSTDVASQEIDFEPRNHLSDSDKGRTFSDLVPYDENLLERSRTQWQFGDWDSLAELNRETLQHHPDRAKLALLAAAGKMQKNQMTEARQLIHLAQDWGVSRKLVTQILASGVHNSLACASSLSGQHVRATQHFESSIALGAPGSDVRLLKLARLNEQLRLLNINFNIQIELISEEASTIGTREENNKAKEPNNVEKLEQNKFKIDTKERLKKVAELRSLKKFSEAEINLNIILGEDANNIGALRELAKIKNLQKQWQGAKDAYNQIIKSNNIVSEAVLQKGLAMRNLGQLNEMIDYLESAKSIGVFTSQIAHQLAIAYRDNHQNINVNQLIDELRESDPKYLQRLDFATFCADVFRKSGRIIDAYQILESAVCEANHIKSPIPLSAKALFEELGRAMHASTNNLEVSKFFYDTIYADSEKYKMLSENSLYIPVWKLIVEIIKFTKIKSILDIGCGPGQFAEFLLEETSNVSYEGIDFSEIAIKQATERCPAASFQVLDFMKYDGMMTLDVDAYIILEVLEHIEQDLTLIEKIPNGKLVIFSVPNFDALAHVRFFKSVEDVYLRYSKYFNELKIEKIHVKKMAFIYLGIGTRNLAQAK